MIRMKHLAAAIIILFAIVILIQYANYLRIERLDERILELEKKKP